MEYTVAQLAFLKQSLHATLSSEFKKNKFCRRFRWFLPETLTRNHTDPFVEKLLNPVRYSLKGRGENFEASSIPQLASRLRMTYNRPVGIPFWIWMVFAELAIKLLIEYVFYNPPTKHRYRHK